MVRYLTNSFGGFAGTVLVLVTVTLSFRFTLDPADMPRVLDERLELSLFAENPGIVTPIGIAIDSLNRIFVLESHTHLPPKDYKGPTGDIIKVFVDSNADGRPDKTTVFADGLKEGLNLAFSPEGHLYAVTSRAVWVLYDRNGDRVCEEKKKVLELVEPASVYAHAALLGITFSPDGWMYVSRGNTGGQAWKLVGTDGSSVSGYGDGGNIVRSRPDGARLEEVATGFWNPMDLKFDGKGHLLAADNDPDSRGPNRLVHVVPGGDYGYKSLYGGSGIHPYLAWNGERPGTLPYGVGLGEAPSGLLAAGLAALPPDYRGQMLATIWEESRIVRINLTAKGASLTGYTQVIVEGGQTFRPVAFATDRNGAIYFTDWVLRNYPNHGKGRIWRLTTRKGIAVEKPQPMYAPVGPDAAVEVLNRLYNQSSPAEISQLHTALQAKDPFLRHAATVALARPAFRQQAIDATRDASPLVRLGAMVALQRSGYQPAEPLVRRLLTDPDAQVRQRALQWVGEAGLQEARADLDKALTAGPANPALFETYLETVAHLSSAFIDAYRNRSEAYAKSIKRPLPHQFVENFVADPSRPAVLRAMAIRYLPRPAEQVWLLTQLLTKEQHPQIRLEAIRALAGVPDQAAGRSLLATATNPKNPVSLRAEALLALARQPAEVSASVRPLLNDPNPEIQLEAVRYLRTRLSDSEAQRVLRPRYALQKGGGEEPLRQQLALALSPADAGHKLSHRPASLAEWQTILATGGDAQRGQRVFYSVQAVCSSCHAVQGRGGDLGPDLSNVGQSKSRTQLVQAILRPSKEISPEWQGWYIRLKNGVEHQGRQIDVGEKQIELYTQAAGFVTFAKNDIQDYGMSKTSLMPDGLEQQLTISDLRDLLAFLQAKK
ncbi:c-type cytochrome [Nibrella saemangeumensis]|uniref:C-type cytochrome n=1 Tax=Nibrella saemangeumensis TaxID=1084526 RepID=A0ABP8MW45_9BACT